MKHLVLLALTALIFAPPAYAQTLDPKAAILKDQIEGFLENQKAVAIKNGSKLVTTGQTTVEKANGYYAFTLPSITFTDAKGIRTQIGMVAVNAVPDGEDNWKISLALPTPINNFDATGKEIVRTDIGTQNASGVWNVKLGHFTSVSSTFGNVRVNDLINQNTVTVGGLTINSNMTELDPGAWTGTGKAELNNISIYNAATNFTGNLPKITLNTNLADRAEKTAMTKDQIKNRTHNGFAGGFNVFDMLLGSPGTLQGVVTGLDSLNTQLQGSMMTAKPEQRQDYLAAILAVGAVSGLGKPVPNDSTSKAYDVVIGQNGAVSINGTDVNSLTQIKK